MKTTKLAVATLALSLSASFAASAADSMVKGEVKKIDQGAGKITLNHGPIKNLDMTDENMNHGVPGAKSRDAQAGQGRRQGAVRSRSGSRWDHHHEAAKGQVAMWAAAVPVTVAAPIGEKPRVTN